MNAPARLELPLDEPAFVPCAQYRRLFGNLSPDQVMMAPPVPSALDGPLGAPSPASCDPSLAMGHLFSPALMDLAALRAKHVAKGHTPQSDAARGYVWFWHGVHQFWWNAIDASADPVRRRKNFIAAAALIIALVDAEDFQQKGETNA